MKKLFKDQKGFSVLEAVLMVIVLLALVTTGYLLYKDHHKTKTQAQATQNRVLSQTQNETSAGGLQNSSRSQDASSIGAAIVMYENKNEGSPPSATGVGNNVHALLICASNCSGSNSQLVRLTHYHAPNVKFHDFSTDIKLPNSETIYIIAQAECGNNAASLTQATGGATPVVVLYDLINGTSPQQQCIPA